MIIKTMAKALIQCSVRTQAGWITLAAAGALASVCCSLAVRLDMTVPYNSRYRFIRRKPSFRYNTVRISSMHGAYHGHEIASRVAPARLPVAHPAGLLGTRTNGTLGRRHQHGV